MVDRCVNECKDMKNAGVTMMEKKTSEMSTTFPVMKICIAKN